MKSCNRAVFSVLLLLTGCWSAEGESSHAAGLDLGAPPPVVQVSQRSDGLAVSWTSISVVSYNVLRGGVLLATVVAPTTSYVDADVFTGTTYCYTVAGVFDDGSATPASSPACAVEGGSVAPPAVLTLTLPLVAPFVTATSMPASIAMASASNTTFVPFALPVGSTITATRATISDNVSGPTKLRVGLMTVDGAGTGAATASAFGVASAGTGAVQNISSASMSTLVQDGRWYSVEVIYASGNAAASVKAAAVDYIP